MQKKMEFTEGAISDRVIRALRRCPADLLLDLIDANALDLPKDLKVTLKSLKLGGLSEYVATTDIPAYTFIYGDTPIHSVLTAEELTIVQQINTLSARQQVILLELLQVIYPKPFLVDLQGKRISPRIMHFLSKLPYGYLSRISQRDMTIPGATRLSDEAILQLMRFQQSSSKTLVFTTDALPPLCLFLGVSLHFMMDLQVPLYCDTQEGDLLFDYYMLLNEHEKKTIKAYFYEGVLRQFEVVRLELENLRY